MADAEWAARWARPLGFTGRSKLSIVASLGLSFPVNGPEVVLPLEHRVPRDPFCMRCSLANDGRDSTRERRLQAKITDEVRNCGLNGFNRMWPKGR